MYLAVPFFNEKGVTKDQNIIIIFIFLNIIENLIYYNGEKYGLDNNLGIYFIIQKLKEFIKLLRIITVLTEVFSKFNYYICQL